LLSISCKKESDDWEYVGKTGVGTEREYSTYLSKESIVKDQKNKNLVRFWIKLNFSREQYFENDDDKSEGYTEEKGYVLADCNDRSLTVLETVYYNYHNSKKKLVKDIIYDENEKKAPKSYPVPNSLGGELTTFVCNFNK